MSKNKKPRKAYRPKPANPRAHEYAMLMASLMPAEDRQLVLMAGTLARDAILRQTAPEDQWRELVDVFNTAEALSTGGICSDDETRTVVQAAQQVLSDLWSRRGASWTLRAEEVAALDEALERFSIQVSLCTLGEYINARHTVKTLVYQAERGNGGKYITMHGPR